MVFVLSPVTVSGVSLHAATRFVPEAQVCGPVLVPSPSSPKLFPPQHFTAPPVSAHVSSPPAAIAITPESRPVTLTAVVEDVVVPSPSWPRSLRPQHFTAPPVVNAQVW